MGEPDPRAPATERAWHLLALGVVALAALVLFAMGRTAWCKCGSPVPWSFQVASMHTSQHLVDAYTLTHVLHGVVLCGALSLLVRGPRLRLGIAVALESAWELLENTSWIIERYRAGTISLDYYGDSVANSLSDVAACALGYAAARRLGLRGSLALFVAVEGLLLLSIRDSLVLNVIMLVHPVPAIRAWQMGQ